MKAKHGYYFCFIAVMPSFYRGAIHAVCRIFITFITVLSLFFWLLFGCYRLSESVGCGGAAGYNIYHIFPRIFVVSIAYKHGVLGVAHLFLKVSFQPK